MNFLSVSNLLNYSELDANTGQRTRSDLNQTNLSFSARLSSQWDETFSSEVDVYRTRYQLNARNTLSNANQTLFQKNQVNETGVKLVTTKKMASVFNWQNGYQFSRTNITNETDVTAPPVQRNVRDVLKTHALFSELSYTSPDDQIFVRAGLRANHFENPNSFNKILIEPRLSIKYALNNALNLQTLAEFKSQGINQIIDLEQNFLGIEKRRWIVSDGDALPLTQSKQGSLGLNYDQQNLYVGVEGFYKEVTGISTTTQGFQNQNQFSGETGRYNIKGIEFLINKKTELYSVWASYGYNVNTYSFSEITPPNFPNNLDIRHTMVLAGSYTWQNLKLSLGLNYRTGKPITQPLSSDPLNTEFFPVRINYDEPNTARLPEYLRADASAIYNFSLGSGFKATAGISVLNFTNRNNILNAYYQLDDDDTIEKIENISLGLTPNVSFRVRF